MDATPIEFQFEYQPTGFSGRVIITARYGEDWLGPDKIDVTSARQRAKLVATLCERWPGLDRQVLIEKLDQIGGEVAARLSKGADGSDASDGSRQLGSKVELLVSLAVDSDEVELFHVGGRHDAEAYATFMVDEHRETWPVNSRAFKFWLRHRFQEAHDGVPGAAAMADAIETISARALFAGPERKVHVRVADDDGTIWLDLGVPDWKAVKVTAEGWSIVDSVDVPVRFIRKRGMIALPIPVQGGSIDELRQFLNLPDDAQWTLFVSVLVSYFRPRGPYIVLIVNGEQGSAKSTLCRILRALLDPNKAALRRPPRDERDLMIAAKNGLIIGYDNLSGLSPHLSDAICTLATGGGFGTRELYSNDDETLFDAMRPVVLNGIDDLASRGDLLDRSVILSLPAIPDDARREDAQVNAAFELARPRILGALLTAVATAIRNLPTTKLSVLPRMADFAVWAVAAEPAFGWKPGAFLDAYVGNRGDANSIAIESSAIGPTLLSWLAETWTGTSKELLDALNGAADEETKRHKDWPKKPQLVSTELRRLAPNLRRIGIEVTFDRTKDRARKRVLTLQRVGQKPSEASEASANGAGDSANADGCGRPPDGTAQPRCPQPDADADAGNGASDTSDGSDTSSRDSSHADEGEWGHL